MADFKITSPRFPEGTTVKAYPASNWTILPPSGEPVGSATAEAKVKEAALEFTGLTEGVEYFAAALVNGKWSYLAFMVDKATEEGEVDLSGYQKTAEKAQANGYASLEAAGKVPAAQLPSAVMEYQGTWDASANTPKLEDGKGSSGDVYRVSVAGEHNFGSGAISFEVGDYAIYNGTTWEKSDTTDAVASVAGKKGAVKLVTADIEGLSTTLGEKQPLDADLTKIGELATQEYGRSLLTAASAEAARTALDAAQASRLVTAVLTGSVGPIKEQTALQNITGLSMALGASATERWEVRGVLVVESANATMDLKLGWSVGESGATGRWGVSASASTVTGGTGATTLGVAAMAALTLGEVAELGSRAGVFLVPFAALVKGGGKAGTLQLQYAQQTSNAADLSILEGSCFQARKLTN